MIPQLPARSLPGWLGMASVPLGPLPLAGVLEDSVYYPASGTDGRPVQYLAGNFFSFIYVDYGIGRDETVEQLGTFRGYAPLAFRDVQPNELTPRGWQSLPPRPGAGDPRRSAAWVRSPFALWAVFVRTPEFGPDHGPERFSLLYIGGDGVATFQALYPGNRATPAAVAIIQPGTGFGGNWTDFRDPRQVFARSVRENVAGVPGLLLFGGLGRPDFYREPCWPEYGHQIAFLGPTLRLWGRSAAPSFPLLGA